MSKPARALVYFAFAYTCIEGLLVNLWYPSLLPYLCKDVALLAAYGLVFGADLDRLFIPSPTLQNLRFPLLIFSVAVGVYLIQQGIGSLEGWLALKQRLFYIPLISIGYLFVRSEQDLKRLCLVLAIGALGAAGFGMYLYWTGPDGLSDLGGRYSAVIRSPDFRATGDGQWRVPGSFNSPGQYGAFLQFNGLVAAALLMTRSVSRRWKSVAGLSMILILLAMLASGSRAPFAVLGASVALLVLGSRKLKGVVAWGLVGYAALAYGFAFFGPGVADRFASIASYEQVHRFQTTYFGQLFMPALQEEPFGSGLGAATIGTRHLSGLATIRLVESYLGILAIEMGIVGLGSFLWVAWAIAAGVARRRRSVERSSISEIWHALAIYVVSTVLILPVSTVIDHAPSNLYFWFSIGVLVKVADLERGKRWAAHDAGRLQMARQPSLALG